HPANNHVMERSDMFLRPSIQGLCEVEFVRHRGDADRRPHAVRVTLGDWLNLELGHHVAARCLQVLMNYFVQPFYLTHCRPQAVLEASDVLLHLDRAAFDQLLKMVGHYVPQSFFAPHHGQQLTGGRPSSAEWTTAMPICALASS